MRKIWFVPIEPYEERYTEQWYRWFKKAFEELRMNYEYVDGEALTDKVEVGVVLDAFGTNYYKASQLMKLYKLIREGEIQDNDIIFFADLWFPGIEGLQYARQLSGKKFQIQGVLHAGTWDEADFTRPMRDWAKHIEEGWFLGVFDKIYLGSEFHKQLIIAGAGISDDNFFNRLVVTGLPFEYKEVQRPAEKENIIVFPHRLDPEKRPEMMAYLKEELEKAGITNWKCIRTKDVTKTKEEYFQLLGKSKIAVSFALQETFGYAMLECMANGCIPIVPNSLSYKTMEIYEGHRVEVIADIINMIREIELNPDKFKISEDSLAKFSTLNFVKQIK